MDRKNKDYLEKDFAKHKPKLFMPIFNTILAIAFTVLMVRVTIVNKVNPIYLTIVILLMLLFVGGSWFNSFFFRKKNQKATQDFQLETELLFNAVYALKKGTYIEPKKPVKFELLEKYANAPKVSFDIKKREFQPIPEHEIFVNLGATCCGLNFDYDSLEVIGFSGMAPYSIWKNKKLSMPDATEGSIKIDMQEFNKIKKLTLKILNQVDSYYDKKSGVFMIGDTHKTVLDENIKISENVVVSFYDNEIKAVYVKLEPNMFAKNK